jgi:class 3 adenylate cyclase/tetratricopeptide (TPR) repeat protein
LFCLACGAAIAPPRREEERKLATILFADLVDSTELGASQDPERTRAILDRFFDAMAAEIETAGGTVEKFAGDAVMAVFGAPDAQEDHGERALHAALSMQRRLDELFGDALALRIGVNTGEVVLGYERAGSSFVTGDAVNVAARLEQAAAPGAILAGERTVAAARGAFEFGEPTAVEAKGKPAGVPCRRVVRAVSLMRPRGVGGLRRAFVGREHELELLQSAYRQVTLEGTSHLVTIVGEAGVGKTRLARELWEWLGGESPSPVRLTGRCLSYGQGITYWPLAEVLKEHLGILERDPPERVLARLGERRILGLTLGLNVAGDLHPLVARDRLHEAWVEFVTELVADRPAVILVEDLHWAEHELLDLLERLLGAEPGPLLLLATGRPELLDARPGWGGARRAATTVELEPLSHDETSRMLDELLAVKMPARLRDVVIEGAEGNPFFVEEVLGTLIDRGVLERAPGDWTVREVPAGFAVPDSVQAVLAARIDLLPLAEKAALQAASVIGRVFWTGPVYELLEGLEPDFRILEERDFVRRRSGSSMAGEPEYAIKHALTREVAYGSVPKAKRARLHAAFADWLQRFGGGRDEHASLLAHHYAEAVRPQDADLAWTGAEDELEDVRRKAVVWLRRAAELAAGRFELREALALLDDALTLETDEREKIELLRRAGEVHMDAYDPEGFRHVLEQALALGPERSVAAAIYAELAHFGRGRPYMWKQPPPLEIAERWLETALELAEPGTSARAEALLARALAAPEAGVEAAAEALVLGQALGSPRLIRYACEAQALVATMAGRFAEACDWVDRALESVPALSNPSNVASLYWLAGFSYLRAGRVPDAAPLAEALTRLAASLTPHDEMHAVALHANLHVAFGRWRALGGLAPAAAAAAEANEETPCQFNWRSLLVCALGLAHNAEEREARRFEEAARAAAVVAGPAEREPAILRLALFRSDLEETERILERLPAGGDPWGFDNAAARLDALVALGDRERVELEAAPYLLGESYTRPFALRALGVVRGDRTLAAQAAALFHNMGLDWHAAQTKAL